MNAKVYNQNGKEAGEIKLPESIFNVPWNNTLVHQVAASMMGNARLPIAHTKTRGEVSGTGRKPWRQKGTGRARHGSRRSPIWVGGGVAHGPRNDKNYSRKINKKMRVRALFSVLSRKFKEGEIVFIDDIKVKKPKTKEAKSILNSLSKAEQFSGINRRKNAAFIALEDRDENTEKSFRNFSNLELGQAKDLNVVDVLKYKYLIITNPEKFTTFFSSRLK